MENNEIMTNTEIIEEIGEIETTGSGTGWKVLAGIGLASAVGALAYKFVVKPIKAKIKAKKELKSDIVIEEGENSGTVDVEEVE